MIAQLQPWAQKQAEQAKYRTVGIYLGVLGLGYNTELLAKKKVPAPACWKDLAKTEYANDVQMANPNASGTAYTAIATLVQVFGEEEAFKLLKAMHKNITNYARQGVGPIKAIARGENLVASRASFTTSSPKRRRGFRSRAWRHAKGPATRSARCRSSRARAISTMQRNSSTGR